MKITVRTRDLDWNENLQKLVERRIAYAVDRHSTRISSISVCISDLNGPRGGVDKLCQMSADVRGIGTLLITETGSNLLQAISNAAGRLGFRVRRSIERRRRPSPSSHRATIRNDDNQLYGYFLG
jgi:ribosome-associated translation inhibitor RaiA